MSQKLSHGVASLQSEGEEQFQPQKHAVTLDTTMRVSTLCPVTQLSSQAVLEVQLFPQQGKLIDPVDYFNGSQNSLM